MSTLYKGDVGTVISLNTGINISTATTVSIIVKKPSGGTPLTWAATIGADNMSVEHTIGTGVLGLESALNEVGHYKLQAKVVMPSGTWHGETTSIQVKDNFS